MPDHGDVDEHKTGLRRVRVEAVLEGADQSQVVVVEASFRVLEAVVVQRVRARVLHPWLEAGTGKNVNLCAIKGSALHSSNSVQRHGDVPRQGRASPSIIQPMNGSQVAYVVISETRFVLGARLGSQGSSRYADARKE